MGDARMTKKSEIDLLVVRSGRTDWDEGGRLQGATDLPLAETGGAGVEAVVGDLRRDDAELKLDAVLHAPDEASVATAKVLTAALGGKARRLAGLAGASLGLWEGLRESELLDRYPTAYKQWREDPASVNPPEGETFVAAQARVLGALAKALDKSGGKRVGVVLRPLEFGMLRAVLTEQPAGRLWTLVEDGPAAARHTPTVASFRAALDALKAGA